ncbi:MAG TPA: response regulator [Chloroflexi bacterium]|nr:response regulator [Chloroflexota bacterium]
MNVPHGPILVVEDVANIREFLAVTLRFKGYPVVTAANGTEALEHIANEAPALVITDILMPKMDGYALVYKLRTNPKTSKIPVIFLSATYVTPEDKEFAMSLGAVRFLEKPVDTEELLLTIAETLTQGPQTGPTPLKKEHFYQEYRQRLLTKLRHKNAQIARTERLLKTISDDQRSVFESLLQEAMHHRDIIQEELDELERALAELDD